MGEKLRPFLKWAGGKRQLLPQIKRHLPGNIRDLIYYEPFIGAGAVFLELMPAKAIINDFNSQLITTYNIIKNNINELLALLELHRRKHNREYFYEIRNIDRDSERFTELSEIEKAGRLIYLNKTCFNGLYRVNKAGHFNVPYGRYSNPSVFEEANLREINRFLLNDNITILNIDFEEAVSNADENSFIYFDPPYHSPGNKNFTSYKEDGFGEYDQLRLCKSIKRLTERGVKCLLSNSDTEFIRTLYSDRVFNIISIEAIRTINSISSERGPVKEVLIMNY
ncbi:MAG: DNA adenine methylase [Treponema sp.]|nr:DNA adenine methylase [Treponema sp.]